MADDTKVAVLGTGIMGAEMARNLLSAGMQVGAWNRSRMFCCSNECVAINGAKTAHTKRIITITARVPIVPPFDRNSTSGTPSSTAVPRWAPM